jgi:hypothetical protein
MKTQIKSSQIPEKIINFPLEEKNHWINWIKRSISRRESKPNPALRHINWLKELCKKLEFSLLS